MTHSSPSLSRAIELAVVAHKGQKRKQTGVPYVIHPLRVMALVQQASSSAVLAVAAVLHDTVEDTWVTDSYLESEFGPRVAVYVSLLTKRKGESKDEALDKAFSRPESALIKLADRLDNISESLTSDDQEFRAKYIEKGRHAIQVARATGHDKGAHAALINSLETILGLCATGIRT